MSNEAVYAGLTPLGLWYHFAAINRIPRPSGQEAQIADYVRSWAARLGFPVVADATGNLCVRVPARQGREAAPVVVLQAHLDMVCERDSGTPYDAERGDIHPVREGDWVRAEGTTLGADNGIGVAAMLHAAECPDLVRGPLDLLFTVDEETGLTGARTLDSALLRGRVLLNLDNEDDGEFCIGCAGGTDAVVTMRDDRSALPDSWSMLAVRVGGLLGGHSGSDIIKPRLNAIRALARLLGRVAEGYPLRLVRLKGGNARNAIPREAEAVVALPPGAEGSARKAVKDETRVVRELYAGAENGLEVQVEAAPGADGAWSAEGTRRLLDLVLTLPCGVIAMSPSVPGLVETSNSVGTAETDGDLVRIGCLTRSSVNQAMTDTVNTLRAAARLAGAEVEGVAGYPGWKPDPGSRVLKVAEAAFRRVFGKEAKVMAVHAGLECGIIGERVAGMDMVSFGPDIKGAHAPGERVEVRSVERFWSLLGAILDDLSKGQFQS